MWIRVIIGAMFFFAVVWLGFVVLRGLARPVDKADEATASDVEEEDLRFRCGLCGMEVRVTRSPGEHVKAPRHCREEMELVPT